MGDKLYSLKEGFKIGFKRARKEAGYTQQEFANTFSNVTVETVRNWEQGRNVPEIDTIEKICEFFRCDMDYLFGRIDYKTHNCKYICEYTGLTEKAVEMLSFIKKESAFDSPYGMYFYGSRPNRKIIGAGKTKRVIIELLESEYERFIVDNKTGIMDNLFAAIDEYMHPLDFEFRVYDSWEKQSIKGQYKPAVMDRAADTLTLVDEDEIYRTIIMSRITKMLHNMEYNLDRYQETEQ